MGTFSRSFLLFASLLSGANAVHPTTTDIHYQDKEMLGPAIWTFSAKGLKIFSPSGTELKYISNNDLPMCGNDADDAGCYYFDYASDGHKYVWAAGFGPNRVDVFDIDTGDYVGYSPTCGTPLDLDYHPLRNEMWMKCVTADDEEGGGHIDSFSTYSLSSDHKQIHLNVTGRAYGRGTVHSTLGTYGYVSILDKPDLYKIDLSSKEVAGKYELPDAHGSYDMTYSPANQHIFVRVRVCCTCGSVGDDLESCGRGPPKPVTVTTGPSAGSFGINGTCSSPCEGSPADTIGVYEFDTVSGRVVASHNIKPGTGFGADPVASPDGKHVLLFGNDGGQYLRILETKSNGIPSTALVDVPVDFQGGLPTRTVISDAAFMELNGKTIVVVGASSDNDIVLVDLSVDPPVMEKIAVSTAEESTSAGASRQLEWAIGTEYVWVNGADTSETYLVQVPGGDITAAKVVKTISDYPVGDILYVENYERAMMMNLIMEVTKTSTISSDSIEEGTGSSRMNMDSSSDSDSDGGREIAIAAIIIGLLAIVLVLALFVRIDNIMSQAKINNPNPGGMEDGVSLTSSKRPV